jgi:tetratricopeptide (TPR) repeat protein
MPRTLPRICHFLAAILVFCFTCQSARSSSVCPRVADVRISWSKASPFVGLLAAESVRKKTQANANPKSRVSAVLTEADILLYLQEPESARLLAERALQLAAKVPCDSLRSQAYTFIGQAKLATGDTLEALDAFTAAIALQKKWSLAYDSYSIQLQVICIEFGLSKNAESALSKLATIKKWAETQGEHLLHAQVLLAQSDIYQATGRATECAAAVTLAETITRSLPATGATATCYVSIGRAALGVGQLALANAIALKAKDIAKSQNLGYEQSEAALLLGQIDEALQAPVPALGWYKRSMFLEDSLERDKVNNFANLAGTAWPLQGFIQESESLRKAQVSEDLGFLLENALILVGGLLACLIIAFLVLSVYSNRKVGKLVLLLKAKNAEVLEQSEKISTLNQTLEKRLQTSTQALDTRTRQLLEYASYNSHIIRGPLARILGLSLLIKNTTAVDEIIFYAKQMSTSADEMDHAVKIVNSKLELQQTEYTANLQPKVEKTENFKRRWLTQ